MNCRCYSVDEVILIISRRIYYEAEDFRLFGGTQEWTAFNLYRRCKVASRSRSDIANKLGVTPQYVSRILSGNTNFSFKSVAEIEKNSEFRAWRRQWRKVSASLARRAIFPSMLRGMPRPEWGWIHVGCRHLPAHQSWHRISCEANTLNSPKF